MGQDFKFTAGFDGTAFKRGVTSVKADMKRFAAETASKWRQAFTVGAAVAGLKEIAEQMIALRRSAEDLGVSTDFLQSIGRMAVKFGGQTEDANNALMKLAETMGQARLEGGAAEEKFTKFGISLYNANGEAKTTEEIFKEIADRYRNATDAATKAAIALEFFGKTGRNINNILGEGAEGIDAYTQSMKDLWMIASPEAVNALADSWGRLKTNFTGLAVNVVGGALSAMERTFAFLGALSGGAGLDDAIDIANAQNDPAKLEQAQRAKQEVEQAQRMAKEAEKLADLEEQTLKVRREGLLETDEDRLKFLKDEVDAITDALEKEQDRVKWAEKRLELEKAQVKVQEQQKKIAADAAALQMERMDRMQDLLKQRAAAGETIADRTRFTFDELANANLRGISDPKLRADAIAIKKAAALKDQAERERLSGRIGSQERAAAMLSQADKIRQGVTSLKSDERFQSMDRNISEVNEGIKAFNNLAKETGFYVRPLIGK